MDPYATHLEALVTVALETVARPITEMGCGDYSTPVLAAIARAQRREYIVYASDEAWAARYHDIADVRLVNWTNWLPPYKHLGMVLLDNEQSTADRIRWLPMLRTYADVVVLHDAQASMARKHWNECAAGFSVTLYQRYEPWTAVLRAV